MLAHGVWQLQEYDSNDRERYDFRHAHNWLIGEIPECDVGADQEHQSSD
nr:hypothetical protein SHINE37_100342 [Rhizobiaceae bacterium]